MISKEQAIKILWANKIKVTNFARKKANRYDVDDIVQEAYMRVFKNLDNIDLTGNILGYLMRAVTNCAINEFRLSKAKGWLDYEELDHYYELPEKSRDESLSQEMKLALNSIPSHLRDVIILTYIMEYTHAEVSAMLKIPTGTVKSRAFRGLRQMKEYLTKTKTYETEETV